VFFVNEPYCTFPSSKNCLTYNKVYLTLSFIVVLFKEAIHFRPYIPKDSFNFTNTSVVNVVV